MHAHFTVLYDASVLYSAVLRDVLLQLATVGLFQAKWTNQIHDEWIGSLLKNRPDLKKTQLERTRQMINESVLDCLVTKYESLIDNLDLPDKNDRHVLPQTVAFLKDYADLI